MDEYEITTLAIADHRGEAIPNRFYRQKGQASRLGVIFPGMRYTCDMPLLHTTTDLLLQHGADVLQLHTDYTGPAFQSASGREQLERLAGDALAGVRVGRKQRNYTDLLLAGKSIGTLAMASLLAKGGESHAAAIWITPLLHQPDLVETARKHPAPALFLASTSDQTYDPQAMRSILEAGVAKALILEGANHSLEIPGDALRSAELLKQVAQTIDQFLASL